MLRFPRKTLSIDFGSKSIKIIEGKCTKDSIQILKAATIDTPPGIYRNGEILDHGALAKVIRDKLSENKIKTVVTHAIINSSEILIREIAIPKVAPEEVKSVVHYQLADYLPVNLDNYVVQYLSQGNTFEGEMERMKILLLAMPKDIVLAHLELLKNVGLRPRILDYQGNAMAKLLKFNNTVNESYALQDLAILSIEIGYQNSEITITKNGIIEVAQIIDFSVQTLYENVSSFFEYSIEEVEEKLKNITSLEGIQEDHFSDEARFCNIIRSRLINFLEQIEAVVKYYNTREVGNLLDCILLQGGLSNIPDIDQMFSTYFNIPAMQLLALDMVRWDRELPKYASAIGGLIRMDVD